MHPFPKSLGLALAALFLAACGETHGGGGGGGGIVSPCRIEFAYSVVGGTLQGTLTNHQDVTLSEIRVSVAVSDRERRPIGTRQLDLVGPFRPGDSSFSLSTGLAAGRYANISVLECRR